MKELIIPIYQAKKRPVWDEKRVTGLLENHGTIEKPLYRIAYGDYAYDIDISTLCISFDNGIHWRSIEQVEKVWR